MARKDKSSKRKSRENDSAIANGVDSEAIPSKGVVFIQVSSFLRFVNTGSSILLVGSVSTLKEKLYRSFFSWSWGSCFCVNSQCFYQYEVESIMGTH